MMFMATCNSANMVRLSSRAAADVLAQCVSSAERHAVQVATILGKAKQKPPHHLATASPKRKDAAPAPRLAPVQQDSDKLDRDSASALP